ncbi:unnamed protein product [Soboliphyme baturini]|uniref:Protein MAK10 homolog n=1 Tax=Soboliphyme baturini TaxID=241478 RepID=A0A183IYV7_9BILA|nr:unnamed protein product [Soboliphyme baturini]
MAIFKDEQQKYVSSEDAGAAASGINVCATYDIINAEWKLITNQFKEAARGLDLGELVRDNTFSLYEGMSAVELMDPKMDPGMLHKRSKCLGFDGAVKCGRLKLKNIPCEELVSIMDAMLASFVTWLEGHSTVLTIFTNLYLHKPHLIEDRNMKAFCLLFYKVVNLCCDIVRRADVFEEVSCGLVYTIFKSSEAVYSPTRKF